MIRKFYIPDSQVAPHVGAWIETDPEITMRVRDIVAPHVGAWIETLDNALKVISVESHPMWVRGLKPASYKPNMFDMRVAPHVGAWIETTTDDKSAEIIEVAPHVGAWIET